MSMVEPINVIEHKPPVHRSVRIQTTMPLYPDVIQSALSWIDSQRTEMLNQVKSLCEINSYSANAAGVNRYLEHVAPTLRALTNDIERIKLNPVNSIDDNGREVTTIVGDALLARSRPDAAFRVLLYILSDTVYPE